MINADVRNKIIADARSVPELIAKASALDPDLAAKFEGKALVNSKTVWGTALTMLVSWAVTRYGLDWSPDTSAEVSGLLVMAATTGLRMITQHPITGITSTPITF